jgi:hypothetical protein
MNADYQDKKHEIAGEATGLKLKRENNKKSFLIISKE